MKMELTRDEAQALDETLRLVRKGGDARIIARSKAGISLARKVQDLGAAPTQRTILPPPLSLAEAGSYASRARKASVAVYPGDERFVRDDRTQVDGPAVPTTAHLHLRATPAALKIAEPFDYDDLPSVVAATTMADFE